MLAKKPRIYDLATQSSSVRRAGFILIAILFATLSLPAAPSQVSHITVPNQGICPDVAVGANGAIYEVYAQNRNAFFVVSHDGGHTFSRPIRLNRVAGNVLAGHERGPKIALSANGAIHAVWMDTGSTNLEYTRRRRNQTSFTRPINLRAPGAHLDGVTIATGGRNNVFIAWLDSRLPPDSPNPLSLPILVRWSEDGGGSFFPAQPLVSGTPLRACSCCSLHAVGSSVGVFDVAFRGAYANIRDPWLAAVRVRPDTAKTRASRVAVQEWKFPGCPMAGPTLARGPNPNEIWVAWYSNGRVFCAHSLDGGAHFDAPVSPAAHGKALQNHPVVLVNRTGDVLLAWEEGRDVFWQLLNADGNAESSGDAGALPPESKATGFVDPQGNFRLVF